jgi:hypothetical protein
MRWGSEGVLLPGKYRTTGCMGDGVDDYRESGMRWAGADPVTHGHSN